MKNQKDVIQHIKEEDGDSYSDDSLFRISSYGADLSFRELIERYEDEELLKPELQRHYVWDRIEASRFIDSILLGLPVPSIFLAQQPDERLLIVDGYQRIMTVHNFVKGIFSTDGKIFRLSKSDKINKRWRGNAFSELTDTEQRKIRNTTIHAIIFVQQEPSNDDTSLFQVFERINTSGRSLMPQEIRNCVAQGDFNKLLFQLNDNQLWRSSFGLEKPDARMRDMEYILRFFALSSEKFKEDDRERISLRRFLDLYMKSNVNPTDQEISEYEQRFNSSIQLVYDVFGGSAFHNVSPTSPEKLVEKFSPTIFDSILIAADYAIQKGGYSIPNDPEQERRNLLRDDEYRFAVTKETMTRKNIIQRISMVCDRLFGLAYE
ncbi:DUF262 domain-containing protein [Shewanella algae]|uniref:DUF262 domain-containing protein n=1 Tax=Shewanella algae TaxID=38313 RepID=UPI001AAC6883|nr:DUF262 domain-containing protein [Shewanella algae]MBO2690124.1 DUF262 domain-containing protein [Shewanella algae]